MVPPDSVKGGFRGTRPRLRGDAVRSTATPAASHTAAKKRVLFVCIGNSCRSQMAEGFARKYGSDVMDVESAGLSPAPIVQPETHRTMKEKGIAIDGQFPKGVELALGQTFDVVVNMSGSPLPLRGAQVVDWTVQDPIGQNEAVYRTVANQIEGLVMRLVLQLRAAQQK